jgi:hypothetical protein
LVEESGASHFRRSLLRLVKFEIIPFGFYDGAQLCALRRRFRGFEIVLRFAIVV